MFRAVATLPRRHAASAPRPFWHRALLALIILVVILLRMPDVLLLPWLQVEDGAILFPHFYAHRGLHELLWRKAEYLPIVANFIGYTSTRLPTQWIPYAYAWIPTLIALACYTMLFGRRFRVWLPSDMARTTACLLFALAPTSDHLLRSNTDYSIWNTLLILIFLCALPLPKEKTWRYAHWAIGNLLIWSHPLTIVVAPLPLYYLFRQRQGRWLYALTLVNLALHQKFGLQSMPLFADLSLKESLLKVLTSAGYAILLAVKTFLILIFGKVGRIDYAYLMQHAPRFGYGLAGLFAIALVLVAIQNRRARAPIALSIYAIFSLSFVSILSRGDQLAGTAPRYAYLQSLLILFLFVLVSWHYSRRYLGRLISALTGLPRRKATTIAAAGVLSLLLLHFSAASVRETGWYRFCGEQERFRQTGLAVRAFFAELAEYEYKNDSYRGIYLRMDRKGDSPIVIDTRTETGTR